MTDPEFSYGYSRTIFRDPRPIHEVGGMGIAACLHRNSRAPFVPDEQDAHEAAYIGHPAVQAFRVEVKELSS